MTYKFKIWGLLVLVSTTYTMAQTENVITIFSKTEGYRHEVIEAGIVSIKKLGNENNFKVNATEDSDQLIAYLQSSQVVIFLNTTGTVFNKVQKEAFKNFINNGGGFVGIHAATDTEYNWLWYGKMIGAYFKSHPHQQEATIKIIDKQHLATIFLNQSWQKFDEWYNFKDISSEIRVLMRLDESSYTGGENGENHPIAWCHDYDGGRVFYTGLGHTKESYTDTTFLKHLLGGIKYTMGHTN